MSAFQDLGLMTELVRAVSDAGYATPTPIQQQSIPVVLSGRDLMAAAQTGTGKTAGFTLPLLQQLMKSPRTGKRPVRALVVVPTRELCLQVADSVRTYGRHLPIRTATIFGGVGMQPQIQALRRGVDIVVATPGRLLDLVQQRACDLSAVEHLVLDEADRMLDMGFIHDIRRVIALLPVKRQSLMFSATFAREIRDLATSMLIDPAQVDVAPRNSAAESVDQLVYQVDSHNKADALTCLIHENDWYQCLVFTRTKHGANRLAQKLVKSGINADAIHGNKSQTARTRALKGFKDGTVRVLVATDIAARGLDIDGLPQVVNFELPQVAEDYVHRIGRTGRAGANGHAISLVCADEYRQLRTIERVIDRKLPTAVFEGMEPKQTEPDRPEQPRRQRRRGGNRSDGGRGQSRSTKSGTESRTASRAPNRAASSNARSGGRRGGGGQRRRASNAAGTR